MKARSFNALCRPGIYFRKYNRKRIPRTNKVSRTGISVRVNVLPPPEPMVIKVISDEADVNTLKGEFLAQDWAQPGK